MAKQYSQEDFARAILRVGISNCNEKLDSIIANYLGGATIIDDNHGSFVVDYNRNNWQNTNHYHQAHKYLNNRFFFSPQNDAADAIIGQVYWALGSGKDVYGLHTEAARSTDVKVHLDPVFQAILNKHHEKVSGIRTYYYNQVYREKISEEYAEKKIQEHSPVLSGDKYEDFLKEHGFEGRSLEQAKLFVDIMNYQNSNARVVDFLDVYSLYHYYIFKKAICNRFFQLVKDRPDLSRTKMCYEYERILAEEIQKHCEKYSCDKNATAWEGLMARSKNNTIGLQVHKCNFMTVLPKMEFENGKLVSLEMMPIVAGFKREGKMDGLPYYAKGEESKEIFDVLDRLSTPYGTKIVKDGDMLKVEL
jgi:hypothetical protein